MALGDRINRNPSGAAPVDVAAYNAWYAAQVSLPRAPDKLHSPMTSTAKPQAIVLWTGGASVGVLKPTVGASATLAPAQTIKTAAPAAPLKPVITPSKVPVTVPVTGWAQPVPPPPEGVEQRALPRPDSVPSLSWITVGLLAAAGLAAYLLFHG
jgi:hypothetical protein